MQKIRVVDYVMSFLYERGVRHAFTLTGGGAMFINDALCLSKITPVFCHHEQACAMAAVGYTKSSDRVGVVMPTTGCGGTNTITGILDAWQDSEKLFVVSGNVNSHECSSQIEHNSNLRKYGVQEADIISIVKPITKYAINLTNAQDIHKVLSEAWDACTSGRPGPVWIDIPMDIQSKVLDLENLTPYDKTEKELNYDLNIQELINEMGESKRPLALIGNGVKLCGKGKEIIDTLIKNKIPFVTTYLTADICDSTNPFYVGRLGTKGDRAGNFAVQNADLLMCLGTSLPTSVTGHRYDLWSLGSKKILIDIQDPPEVLIKNRIKIDKYFNSDVSGITQLEVNLDTDDWLNHTSRWKNMWWGEFESLKDTSDTGRVNIYQFMMKLSDVSEDDAIIVSDAGSAYYTTSQSFRFKGNQKYVTSGAQADMGFSLPSAIGASIANPGRRVYAITGDGSLQLNIQELQTIKQMNLPITICVLNNNGYLSIRNTIDKFFESRYIGTGPETGLTFPSNQKIADAYGIEFVEIDKFILNDESLELLLGKNTDKPIFADILCSIKQDLAPSVSSKKMDDGRIVSLPLHNMFPFLDDTVIENEMIVKYEGN